MDGRPEKSVLWSDPELLGYGVPFLACSSLAAGRVALLPASRADPENSRWSIARSSTACFAAKRSSAARRL